MHYFGKCLFALVTPWGRLSPVPFAAMAFLLIGAHCAIQIHITALAEDLPPYNAWSMSLFVLMWIGFCITSRRFHDGGQTAFWLVPLLVVTFASYLAVFDNLHFATSVFEEDRDVLRWSERTRFALQIASLVAMVVALVRPGDMGDNTFGHAFDEPDHGKSSSRTARSAGKGTPTPADRKMAVTAHHGAQSRTAQGREPAFDAPAAARRHGDPLPSGPRGRITPADNGRPRGDGFGRR